MLFTVYIEQPTAVLLLPGGLGHVWTRNSSKCDRNKPVARRLCTLHSYMVRPFLCALHAATVRPPTVALDRVSTVEFHPNDRTTGQICGLNDT